MKWSRGYDREIAKPTERTDCRTMTRFDTERGELLRFVVQLQYSDRFFTRTESDWFTIAQFDHDPGNPDGHDIYEEGLHIDVYRRDGDPIVIVPPQSPLPSSRGAVVACCETYLREHATYFVEAYAGMIEAENPPYWPET